MSQPVVLITGASSGIGAATARLFAARGFTTLATMRSPHDDALHLDVTDPASITACVATVMQRHGRIDVLVNNAGYGLIGPLEGLTAHQIRRQFDTNVLGLIAVTQAVIPHMRAVHRGSIINVASIGGRMAFPFSSAYHATKFAVEGLSESLRFELAPFGIHVRVVEPGGIRTDFGSRSMELAVAAPYDHISRRMLALYRDRQDALPGPERVAETILRAAKSTSRRLRWPVHHQPYAALHSLLPDALWQRIVATMVGKREPTP